MKFYILSTNGRSGSDFFHSLLDDHSQIASFPGYIDIQKLHKQFENSKNIKHFVEKFIAEHESFFDSRKNKIENHHKLGIYKNQFYKIREDRFMKIFFLLNKKNINFKKIIINLHLAYHKIARKNVGQKVKIIFIHAHHLNKVINYNGINFKLIYTFRHPISILNSGINAFFGPKKNLFSSNTLNFYISRIVKEPFFVNINKKIYLIRLENLHTDNKKMMIKFSRIIGIKFEKSLLFSTFMGKLWWGDIYSKKLYNNFKKNFKININKNNFDEKDFYIIQSILNEVMEKCNYNKIHFKKSSYLKFFLPLKIEKEFFKRILKTRDFKEIVKFIIFYFKRVSLFLYLSIGKKKLNKVVIV